MFPVYRNSVQYQAFPQPEQQSHLSRKWSYSNWTSGTLSLSSPGKKARVQQERVAACSYKHTSCDESTQQRLCLQMTQCCTNWRCHITTVCTGRKTIAHNNPFLQLRNRRANFVQQRFLCSNLKKLFNDVIEFFIYKKDWDKFYQISKNWKMSFFGVRPLLL